MTGNKGLWRASGQAGFASLDARGEREAREVEAVAAAKAGAGGGVTEGGYGHFMAGEVASEGPQPLRRCLFGVS